MLNIGKSYLKIWEIEDKGKWLKATTSSGRKDKQNDTWVNSSWNVKFVGKCVEQAKQIKDGDRITVLNAIVENVWDKEKEKSWVNVTVFEIEAEEENDDPLPFS